MTSFPSFFHRGTCRDQPAPAAGAFGPISQEASGRRQQPTPLPSLPARPRGGGGSHGPASPRSLPAAGVYVIRCESLQIPPLCVIWAGRSILPPSARRNNGEPPGLPETNQGWKGFDTERRGKCCSFRRKSKLTPLVGLSFAPRGVTLVQVLSTVCSVPSIPLPHDSRRDCESRHLCFNGLVAKSPF